MDGEGASGIGDWDECAAQPAMGRGAVREGHGAAARGGGRGANV
jgi:hypothetical protein